jgi:hypothetical protein
VYRRAYAILIENIDLFHCVPPALISSLNDHFYRFGCTASVEGHAKHSQAQPSANEEEKKQNHHVVDGQRFWLDFGVLEADSLLESKDCRQ